MNKPSKKRLCWNCEGSVSLETENCPYCGVSVVPATLENVNINAGFAPSYRMGGNQEDSIPKSSFAINEDTDLDDDEKQETTKEQDGLEVEVPSYDEFKRSLVATTLLLSGSVLFMFGLALLLFSRNGVLTLQWDGSLWFIYVSVALPLLLLGWRFLSRLDR